MAIERKTIVDKVAQGGQKPAEELYAWHSR